MGAAARAVTAKFEKISAPGSSKHLTKVLGATRTSGLVVYWVSMPVDTRLTYEDYCLLPSDGKRFEIIDGELYVTPSPLTRHQLVVMNLLYYLVDFVKKHGLGEVYPAPLDVVLSPHD